MCGTGISTEGQLLSLSLLPTLCLTAGALRVFGQPGCLFFTNRVIAQRVPAASGRRNGSRKKKGRENEDQVRETGGVVKLQQQ